MKRLFTIIGMMGFALATMAQYTIYPVPQKMTAKTGTAQFSENVCIVADKAIDAATIERAQQVLREHGMTGVVSPEQSCTSVIYLKVDQSVAVKNKFDAHTISLMAQPDGMASLTITGENTTAAFYGLASLEQMLDEKGKSSMPCVEIKDYADQRQRGIVEGYYGYPYSVAVKKDLMRYMMRLKMNTYLYGAKSDPYHSGNWKDPYPTSITEEQEEGGWLTQDMVRELSKVSSETKVSFIWAIHPGNNFLGSETVINDIMNKFKSMHGLGVRQFAVFVDDVSIPSTEPDMKKNADRLTLLQKTIEETFNVAGTADVDTVRPLHFVPQIYCRGFAGSQEQFEGFFRALAATPEYITIYTTGWGVWSVPNVSDFNNTAQYLGREVAWWWNYPCNDNADNRTYAMDMYHNFVDMPAVGNNSTLPADMQNRGIGIVSNPMQQGEIAKIPLFSVADYAWHCSGFDNKKSWEASFAYALPNSELAKAFRKLAPYISCNDPNSGTEALTAGLTLSVAKSRIQPLIEAAELLMTMKDSDKDNERLLWTDLSPWVLRLHSMLKATLTMYEAKSMANTVTDGAMNEAKWNKYVEAINILDDLDENPKFFVKTIEGWSYKNIGTHKTIPANGILYNSMQTLKSSSIKGFAPAPNTRASYITNTDYSGNATTSTTGTTTYYLNLAARNYAPGEYVGMTFPKTQIMKLEIADSLYNGREIRVSSNGTDWTVLPKGEQMPTPIRHIIIVNTSDQVQSTRFAKAVINAVPKAEPTIVNVTVPSGTDVNDHGRALMTDGNFDTWFAVNAEQRNDDNYVLELSEEAPINMIRVAIGTTNGDCINTGRVEISTNGTTWKKISPVGTTKTVFTMSDMNPYSDDCKILDFNAKNQNARYIRLYNQTAYTNKWLRINEIMPMFAIAEAEFESSFGTPLYEAYDGEAHTSIVPAGKSFKVNLPYINDVEKITLLTDKGIEVIDMTSDPKAKSYTYKWTGDAPRIYEAFVTVSDKNSSTTGVENIKALVNSSAESTMTYDLQGRTVTSGNRHGIFIENGRKIIK